MATVDKKLAQRFGMELRAMRENAGISQQDLALDCELDRTYVSLLERGLRQPTLTTIFRLAEHLGKRPSRLLAAVESEK